MATKKELKDAVDKVREGLAEIERISGEHRSLMYYTGTGKEKYGESFGSLADRFIEKSDFYLRVFNTKFVDMLPAAKRGHKYQ